MRKYLLASLVLAVTATAGLWLAQPQEPPLATSGQRLTATLVKQWTSSDSPAREAAFSPDGRLLAISNAAGEVTVMETVNWRPVRHIKVPGGTTSLALSGSGARLFTAGYDGIVRLWQLSNGKVIREYRGASGPIWTLDLSPAGREFAAAGEDGFIRLWSVETGKARMLKGHERNVWAVRFSPDGKALASGSFDHSARIWRGATSQAQILNGHRQAVVGLDISPNGSQLATGSDDSTVRLWRMADGEQRRVIEAGNHVYNVAFSPDGKWFATAGRARGGPGTLWHQLTGLGGNATAVHLWRASDGAVVAALPHPEDVMYVAFSPDQRHLVTSGEDGVRLWRLAVR